MMEPRLEKM